MKSLMRSTAILIMLFSFFACKDDNGRETAKVAPVSNVTYTAAHGAILFEWDNPKIDNLAYIEISYADKAGNVRRCLTQGGLSQQWIEGIGDNDPYYFRFVAYNTEGQASEPVELMAAALEATVNLFYGRVKLTVDFSGVNVSWENSYDENFYIELSYTDLNGNNFSEEVVVGAYTTGKQLVKIGASLTGSQSLDIYAKIVDENGNESEAKMLKFFKKEVGRLSRANWKLISFSSEESSSPCAAMLDGNSATYWHTRWKTDKANYPHWAIIDLGSKKHLEKIGVQQRPTQQLLKGVALYGNNVSANPGDESVWKLFYEFEVAESTAEQQFEFDPVEYRYFKIVFTTPSGLPDADPMCAACAELNLYGADVVEE